MGSCDSPNGVCGYLISARSHEGLFMSRKQKKRPGHDFPVSLHFPLAIAGHTEQGLGVGRGVAALLPGETFEEGLGEQHHVGPHHVTHVAEIARACRRPQR